MIPGKSTGCPNLASCAFCDCIPHVTIDDSTLTITDAVPDFKYIVSYNYENNASLKKPEKLDHKKEHSKHLLKLQKKRF